MTLARAGAARLRGVFVGASAGAVAVAAHGVGGTALPASPSIVLMVLLCAVVGAVASSPAEIHRRPPVVRVYVLAAQLVGHCTWVFVSTHTHANHWSVQIMASHVVAAFICAAALICTAERLFGALAGVLWHLILVLLALRDDDHPPQSYRAWAHTGLTSRILACRGLGTAGLRCSYQPHNAALITDGATSAPSDSGVLAPVERVAIAHYPNERGSLISMPEQTIDHEARRVPHPRKRGALFVCHGHHVVTYAGAHVSDIHAALNWERPQLDTAPAHEGHGGTAPAPELVNPTSIDYNSVIAAAGRAGISAPEELTLPTEPGGGIAVTEIDKLYRLTTNAATVDPTSTSVTSEIDYWRDYSVVGMLADWGIRMHMGCCSAGSISFFYWGVAGTADGDSPGLRMWWQRRPTRGSDWAVGRPPMRAASVGSTRRLWL